MGLDFGRRVCYKYTMKIIVAGSIEDYERVSLGCWLSAFDITAIISGGVDRLGERWAESCGIPVISRPANWARFGRAAGAYRNAEMASEADGLIAFWDGSSRGTLDMIGKMGGKPVEIWDGLDYVRRGDWSWLG